MGTQLEQVYVPFGQQSITSALEAGLSMRGQTISFSETDSGDTWVGRSYTMLQRSITFLVYSKRGRHTLISCAVRSHLRCDTIPCGDGPKALLFKTSGVIDVFGT